MVTVLAAVLATTVSLGEPPAPRSRAPLSAERIDAMLFDPTRHVRGVGDTAADLLAHGARRSYTFARLLDSLERSDVIVYVEFVPDMRLSLAGRMMLAGSAHGQRYLRIQVGPGSDEDMVATLAHELQHANEVAGSPDVHSETALAALYRRIGHTMGDAAHFDTMAAREVGRIVRGELAG
jgi:hypothetical protein